MKQQDACDSCEKNGMIFFPQVRFTFLTVFSSVITKLENFVNPDPATPGGVVV